MESKKSLSGDFFFALSINNSANFSKKNNENARARLHMSKKSRTFAR